MAGGPPTHLFQTWNPMFGSCLPTDWKRWRIHFLMGALILGLSKCSICTGVCGEKAPVELDGHCLSREEHWGGCKVIRFDLVIKHILLSCKVRVKSEQKVQNQSLVLLRQHTIALNIENLQRKRLQLQLLSEDAEMWAKERSSINTRGLNFLRDKKPHVYRKVKPYKIPNEGCWLQWRKCQLLTWESTWSVGKCCRGDLSHHCSSTMLAGKCDIILPHNRRLSSKDKVLKRLEVSQLLRLDEQTIPLLCSGLARVTQVSGYLVWVQQTLSGIWYGSPRYSKQYPGILHGSPRYLARVHQTVSGYLV